MQESFRILSDGSIECLICPHSCKIREGKSGICKARKNTGGKIELITYGLISGIALDPIEKKPLYHYFPGSGILSIGSWGCNMRCDFCQNYHISQDGPPGDLEPVTPEEVAAKAIGTPGNTGVAYTYNEPVIWYEFVMDVAERIKTSGLKNIMVTNGFVSPGILDRFLEVTDAFNVDLKAFSNRFYRDFTGSDIEPVKEALKKISKAGSHLEVTTLVITGRNDSVREMDEEARWIKEELGDETPLHLSRYFPMYKRHDPVTTHEKLHELLDTARKHLKYVYSGNTLSAEGQDTVCPDCGKTITVRKAYEVVHVGTTDGNCSLCGRKIYGSFTFSSSSRSH